jgi:chemotaxis signal transduction protein
MNDSALRSLEELERLYRERAIQPPPMPEEPPKWVGTSLGIADVPLLVAEGDIEEIIETPAVVSIPNTKPWVMGVASYMGGLLPIISGDVFFRKQPYQGRIRDWCMVIRRQGFRFGMTLSSVERDLKFPQERLDPAGPVDPDFAAFARGGFYHRDRFLAVLDMERLLADSDLADASAREKESIEENTNE